MIPPYIRSEVVRRARAHGRATGATPPAFDTLSDSAVAALAAKHQVDLAAARQPYPAIEETVARMLPAGLPRGVSGSVEFDLQIEMLDEAITRRLRAVYCVTVAPDSLAAAPATPPCAYVVQVLAWARLEGDDGCEVWAERSAPVWQDIDLSGEGLLPETLLIRIGDLVEEAARAEMARRVQPPCDPGA